MSDRSLLESGDLRARRRQRRDRGEHFVPTRWIAACGFTRDGARRWCSHHDDQPCERVRRSLDERGWFTHEQVEGLMKKVPATSRTRELLAMNVFDEIQLLTGRGRVSIANGGGNVSTLEDDDGVQSTINDRR
jgi:hypothetical protein